MCASGDKGCNCGDMGANGYGGCLCAAGSFQYDGKCVKYFQISEMPVVSGRYWNMVHGNTPDEVRQDAEGLQNMRILAKNMAYLLKCKQAAAKAGIIPPDRETPEHTNFIR